MARHGRHWRANLRCPQLEHHDYSTFEDLAEQVEAIVVASRMREPVAAAIRAELAGVAVGDTVSLLLTGLPYYGDVNAFDEAEWSGLLSTPSTRSLFLRAFNDFSSFGAEVNDYKDFLANYLQPDPAQGSLWKRYVDMLHAMSYARWEISGETYDGASSRPFIPAVGTTWLRYLTFRYRPVVPPDLAWFFADACNRDELTAQYTRDPAGWNLAVKLPLPLAGTIGFLLTEDQASWLREQRQMLRDRLQMMSPSEYLGAVGAWRQVLDMAPIPVVLINYFERLLRADEFGTLSLLLDRYSVSE